MATAIGNPTTNMVVLNKLLIRMTPFRGKKVMFRVAQLLMCDNEFAADVRVASCVNTRIVQVGVGQ